MMFRNKLAYILLLLLILSSPSYGREPLEYDLIRLKSGAVVEGCITKEHSQWVIVESLGGSFTIPMSSIDKVVHADPGESELLLGIQLAEQHNFDKARSYLNKAATYSTWRTESEKAIKHLEQLAKEREEERREEEKRKIERLIRHRGVNAGISELERRYKESDDYWGTYRGRLHLLMARDSIDHLDFHQAERQLKLAANYGADPEEWEKVRQEYLSLKKESIQIGEDVLLAKRNAHNKQTEFKTPSSSQFLALVQKAEKRGEKLPPVTMLKLVDQYSRQNDLDPLLIWALIDTESSWQKNIVSSKGAQGLMQLMPLTAKDLEITNPFDPEENIRGGTQYLRFLQNMFDDTDTALAAYYVGPGRVERNGVPTAGKQYIQKVRTRLAALQKRFDSLASSS